MRFLATLLILFSLQSFADDHCTEVTISTGNMPRNNNQNEHNWCVFWSGADLFSFYEKMPVSSYDLALQYFNHDLVRIETVSDYSDNGANITAALIIGMQGKGLCLESQTNFTDSNWMDLSILFKKISSPTKKLSQIICQNHLENSLPFKDIPKDILKILDQLTGDKKTAAILDLTCGKRLQLGKYGVGSRAIEHYSSQKIIEKLDDLISANNPATVSYDWNFIINNKDYVKKESNHSSTIIGRRYNSSKNECEYLIKDSAGNRCPKNSPYECNSDKGSIWVPKKNLLNNIYEVNWLVKAKN